jgi:hypothetical protein
VRELLTVCALGFPFVARWSWQLEQTVPLTVVFATAGAWFGLSCLLQAALAGYARGVCVWRGFWGLAVLREPADSRPPCTRFSYPSCKLRWNLGGCVLLLRRSFCALLVPYYKLNGLRTCHAAALLVKTHERVRFLRMFSNFHLCPDRGGDINAACFSCGSWAAGHAEARPAKGGGAPRRTAAVARTAEEKVATKEKPKSVRPTQAGDVKKKHK